MGELLKLAERCEQATGPDRDLDARIWCVLNNREFPAPPYTQMLQHDRYDPSKGQFKQSNHAGIMLQSYKDNAPPYTASLDAALTLVPEGWHLGGFYDQFQTRRWHTSVAQLPTEGQLRAFDAGKTFGVECEHGEGATGPLALCAAALRARENSHTLDGVKRAASDCYLAMHLLDKG